VWLWIQPCLSLAYISIASCKWEQIPEQLIINWCYIIITLGGGVQDGKKNKNSEGKSNKNSSKRRGGCRVVTDLTENFNFPLQWNMILKVLHMIFTILPVDFGMNLSVLKTDSLYLYFIWAVLLLLWRWLSSGMLCFLVLSQRCYCLHYQDDE
jgi:hypothetical protein